MLKLICCGLIAGITFPSAPGLAISIDWVAVGSPGNQAEEFTGLGAVAYTYEISRYEVTNAQYTSFLNAVAASDPNGAWFVAMGDAPAGGGIARSGTNGSYTYAPIAGREQFPVNWVSFYNALRFANWLHNGQPIGAQGASTTEDGAYTITAQGIADNSIVRNPGATIALPSHDEWFKAAYHDAVGLEDPDYFLYPAGSNVETNCSGPTSAANHANCQDSLEGFADVGSYLGSSSPYGTFDQGGNAWEWTEEVIGTHQRVIRGGAFNDSYDPLAANDNPIGFEAADPSGEVSIGFRIVMVPEPGTGLLVLAGLASVAARQRRF